MRCSIILIFLLLIANKMICQSNNAFFDYDQGKERKSEIVQTYKIDSLTVFEKIILEGYDSKIPFYYYNNNRNNKSSNIILLHGLGDSKTVWVHPSEPYLEWSRNLTSIKDSLLQLGYNLIIPDAKFHGERSYELNFRPPEYLPPSISKNEHDSKLMEVLITSTVKDLRIIMDYVESRQMTITPSFSTVGYSMGGNIAILLSAVDNRINSVVGCVPPINLPARGLESFNWSKDIINGQLFITPMKYAHYQDSPIMLLMGKNDFFTTENEARQFYNSVPIEEKELKYFDSGHILPNTYKLDVIRWITRYH